VHEHIGDSPVGFLNGPLYFVRDVVPFAHCNARIYPHMKIDIKAQAHLPNETLFDLNYTWDSYRSVSHPIDNFSTRGCIHDFVQSWAQ
jgi:hypothetical protein